MDSWLESISKAWLTVEASYTRVVAPHWQDPTNTGTPHTTPLTVSITSPNGVHPPVRIGPFVSFGPRLDPAWPWDHDFPIWLTLLGYLFEIEPYQKEASSKKTIIKKQKKTERWKNRYKKFNGCEFRKSGRKSPANGTASSPEKCRNSSHINGLIWGFILEHQNVIY